MLLPDLSALLSLKHQPLKPSEVRHTVVRRPGGVDDGRMTSMLNGSNNASSSYWTRRSRMRYSHGQATQQADNRLNCPTTDNGTLSMSMSMSINIYIAPIM